MAEVSSDEKAQQFLEWCRNEMHYRPRGRYVNSPLPDTEQVKQLFRGQAADIINYLIYNVHSKQTVKKVKGNLALKCANVPSLPRSEDESASGEVISLQQRHSSLVQTLHANKTAVNHVEKDLNRLKNEIIKTEKSCRESAERSSDCRRKAALLLSHSQQVLSSVDLYDEFRKRIAEKTSQCSNRAKKASNTQLYSKQTYDSESHGQHNLETACTKSVRETCLSIGSFLHQLLQGKFADATDTLATRKDTLWTKVDGVCVEYPPSQMVISLSVYAQNSAIALGDKTSNVNIGTDAENLRFKYEANGHLRDTSVAPSMIQTVSTLLEDAHRANIHRFMETEKSKNSAWKLSDRLDQAKQPVLGHLSRSYRGDPGALQLATTLLDKETQVVVSRANLRQLHHISEELKDRISKAIREKEVLYSKYQKIQDFTKIVDQKQNLIRVLVKQNLNARSKLEVQQRKIAEYVQKVMSIHEPETRSHNANLTDSVSHEVEAFAALSLPFLMFTALDDAVKVAVIDLSISKTNDQSSKSICCETLRDIRELLECQVFKAPECLTQQVWKLKTEVADIETVLTRDNTTWDAHQGPLIARVGDICKEVNCHDIEQLEQLLPLLNKRVSLATQALTDCLNVKDAVQFWWDQPSQNITPWLKVEDLSFQQWHDKWTVLATRLRQMQVQQ